MACVNYIIYVTVFLFEVLTMKMKEHKKSQLEEQSHLEIYVSEIEKVSLELQKVAEQTKSETEEFYLQMPEMESFEEVDRRVESLNRAAAYLSKSLAQTLI